MAILGIQFLISVCVAFIMQKLSPYYSLARWIMCSGLYRYLYPTNETLKTLAGRTTTTKPQKGKRNMGKYNTNGHQTQRLGIESFTIPCNLDIVLEKTKVEEVDIYSQHKYQDYNWFIDVSLCAFVVYICVEIAVLFRTEVRTQEFNLSLVWCCIVIFCAVKELLSLTAAYWRSDDSGERSMCISFGLFFLILSMGILIIDESILEFGLETGYKKFMDNLTSCMKQLGFTTKDPPPIYAFKLALAAFSAVIGAILGFPGLRLANLYLDSLHYCSNEPFMQILLYASLLSPLIPLIGWIKPMSRDLIVPVNAGNKQSSLLTEENFSLVRICTVISMCILRLLTTKRALQSYLNMANERVKKLRKETGKITNIELQGKVARIFFYMSAVALQYLAPVLMLLFLSFAWIQLYAAAALPVQSPPLMGSLKNSSIFQEGSKYVLILRKACYNLDFFQGLISYFIWWTLLCWFSTTAFGVFYLKTFNN